MILLHIFIVLLLLIVISTLIVLISKLSFHSTDKYNGLFLITKDIPKKLKKKKVIICGLLRNGEKYIDHIKKVVYTITPLFLDYRIIIYENDSIDKTREMLNTWEKKDNNVIILGNNENLEQTINHDNSKSRISKMVYLRNKYLQYIRNNYPDYNYTIIMDLDIIGYLSMDGVINSFSRLLRDRNIDAIAAQGYRIKKIPFGGIHLLAHGDSYAFSDYILKDLDKKHKAIILNIYPSYPFNFENVISAFNGFTIYRTGQLIKYGYRLTTSIHNEIECEHISLHKNLRLYVNPEMLYIMEVNG